VPARSSLPDVFDALGDPSRRFLLETLSERGVATATELAAETGRPALCVIDGGQASAQGTSDVA